MAAITGASWTRLRPIGRGASGAVVSLAADDVSGEVFVVKSAAAGGGRRHGTQQLRREWSMMLGLSSPHVVGCLGYRSTADGDELLFLEFAPGGSLADVAARNAGRRRLEEGAIRAYAADVVTALDYLHRRLIVHGDVKGSNVLLGADGRAKLADFGCARAAADSSQTFAGTPAFMAPEVARGEEQGPAADVWALGCTVIEMATGCAPWKDTDNVLAAVRRIGFTDAVPEVPPWLSPEAKDFLDRCLHRRAGERSTAAQLLHHPFVSTSSAWRSNKEQACISTDHWVSPTSALDAALWEYDDDDDEEQEDDDKWSSPVSRIRAMACSSQALPDWDSDEGWIQVVKITSGNDDVAAAGELSGDAVFSIEVGVCSGENLVERQEINDFSLSCCSEPIVVDAIIEECFSFSCYLHLLSCFRFAKQYNRRRLHILILYTYPYEHIFYPMSIFERVSRRPEFS